MPGDLKTAFEKALSNDPLVTPYEWSTEIKPLFLEAIERKEGLDPAFGMFAQRRDAILVPSVLREMETLLAEKGIQNESFEQIKFIAGYQAAVAGLLLALANDADGLTAAEWKTAYQDRLSHIPGSPSLRSVWESLGAGPVNLFLLYALGERVWIDPAVLNHLDDPNGEGPSELVPFGVSSRLVAVYRSLNIPPVSRPQPSTSIPHPPSLKSPKKSSEPKERE